MIELFSVEFLGIATALYAGGVISGVFWLLWMQSQEGKPRVFYNDMGNYYPDGEPKPADELPFDDNPPVNKVRIKAVPVELWDQTGCTPTTPNPMSSWRWDCLSCGHFNHYQNDGCVACGDRGPSFYDKLEMEVKLGINRVEGSCSPDAWKRVVALRKLKQQLEAEGKEFLTRWDVRRTSNSVDAIMKELEEAANNWNPETAA